MNSIIFALLISASALVATAGLFSPKWDALKVSWYVNPFSSWGFNGLPRSVAENNGLFALRDDQCVDRSGNFLGQRYWNTSDPTITVLFDTNGIIAGLQTSVPKSKYTPYPQLTQYHIDDGDYWTLTAYFVDPSTICTTGRTSSDLSKQGTGTGLWLQYGPNPITDSVSIPVNEADIKQTNWGYGKCFPSMGQHYWYNVSKSMDCAQFVPNCILYNSGKLSAFCFATNAVLDSQRYDNPAPSNQVVNKFLDPVPDCFFSDSTYSTLSTLHVYFNSNPRLTSFC